MESPRPAGKPLDLEGVYLCPVCHHGHLRGLALMDAFGCSFCRHIFAADLAQGTVRLEDSPQRLVWRWQGQGWQLVRPARPALGMEVWVLAGALILVPTLMVGVAYWLFPPLPDAPLVWFPLFWTGLTLVSHALWVGWLMAEYYQPPVYTTWRMRLARWLNRLSWLE
ncbi:MAG: hypothetical protein IGQ88_00715 [Gloeomargaritaceae cyanobacterium C42_A2020_066]|nr:hypothetical protein [Gloeomargaritaceae cyanobacterium C42_A2020_066]